MATINEAYHVLRDAGRRALYDRSLRAGPAAAAAGERSAGREWADAAKGDTTPQVQFPTGPARVPWRSLLVAGTVAVVGIVVLAQFTDPGPDPPPDNILRNGDCVEFLDNGDAREVRCTGVDDNVVRAFVAFDATCPGFTEAHRDRQGMGVACVEVPTP